MTSKVDLALDDFELSIIALRLELPDIIWRDVWRRWAELRRDLRECSDNN